MVLLISYVSLVLLTCRSVTHLHVQIGSLHFTKAGLAVLLPFSVGTCLNVNVSTAVLTYLEDITRIVLLEVLQYLTATLHVV